MHIQFLFMEIVICWMENVPNEYKIITNGNQWYRGNEKEFS